MKRSHLLQIRLTGPEWDMLKKLSRMYSGGKKSTYARGQMFNAPRKFHASKLLKRIKSKRP